MNTALSEEVGRGLTIARSYEDNVFSRCSKLEKKKAIFIETETCWRMREMGRQVPGVHRRPGWGWI